uniref:Nucleotide-diphospho-sugar transferase domain-containing protein n=1 Tax=viral metagenome TaxID=1070528 RepID=A0A6C0BJK2_9ZZZZ
MNIIFGTYDAYNSLKTEAGGIYYFMKSLRKYSDCKVVILCHKRFEFEELKKFANEMNFEIYTNYEPTCYMLYYRFKVYKEYLMRSETKYEKILMSDVTDLIFQEDPFGIEFTEDMFCALETNKYFENTLHSQINVKWIKECLHLPNMNLDIFKDKHVICAGTILGKYDTICKYLEFYDAIQNYSINRVINDQGLLNTYVYSNLCSASLIPWQKSKILTLDNISFNKLKIVNNSIVNENNEKYAIIHQINRCNLEFMLRLVE